jgi:hypothetical protein
MTGSKHANPVAGEAVLIALMHRQWVEKVSGTDSPVTLVAYDRVGLTLVHAARSKKPVNDARTAMKEYYEVVVALDAVGQGAPCNRALWITSRPHGWVFYEVARCSLVRMDKPFSPQIRYTWDGSFKARSANHPIRMMAVPDSTAGAEKAPVATPADGRILS